MAATSVIQSRIDRAAFILWALMVACDGGGPNLGAQGREPRVPGEPAPLCDARTTCAPGTACVPGTRETGHCLPVGSPGGPCALGDECAAGLACAGKDRTCVPVVAAGESCTAAACSLPSVCDRELDTNPTCASPGANHGACRTQSPVCDAGLGCLAGLCRPLAKDGACFRSGAFAPCPEGQLCSHFFGDPGDAPGQCLLPSVVGGACGDPDLGRPACVEGSLCVDGQCRLDAVAPGGTCIVGAPNVRCGDASTCVRNVCISLGTETAPCRPLPSTRCDAELTCKDNVCRSFIADGQTCEPRSGALIDCRSGASCMRQGAVYVCAPDGFEGGACLTKPAPCRDDLVCARGVDGVDVCRVPLALGTTCSLAREPFEPCSAGASCSKSSRLCEPNGSQGAACAGGETCEAGLWCVRDSGVPRCHPSPPTVALGQACDTNPAALLRTNRCEDSANCVGGTCVARGAQGSACRSLGVAATRCDAGLACVTGRCEGGAPAGSACLPGGDGECAAPFLCVATGQAGACRQVGGYAMSKTARDTFIDACDGGTALQFATSLFTNAPRDDGDEVVPLPWKFTFFAEAHDSLSVSVNGVAGFPGSGAFLNPGPSGVLPAAGQPALIAPFWDDLVATGRSRVCTKTIGQAPQRRFVVTWLQMQRFGHRDSSLTFSLILDEIGSAITFLYGDLYAPPGFESVVSGVRAMKGLQAAGGFAFVQSAGPVSLAQELSFVPLP